MSAETAAAGVALYPSGSAAVGSGSSIAGLMAGAGSVPVPVLTILGVSLGLRPDILFAGFCGALVSILLLNSVPLVGEGVSARISNTVQRLFVALSSSVSAGYLTPLIVSIIPAMSEPWVLGSAFVIGGGARVMLQNFIKRYAEAIYPEHRPAVSAEGAPK